MGEQIVGNDLEVIKRIVEAFERSEWKEIDVRSGSTRVHLSTDSLSAAPPVGHREQTSGAPRPADDVGVDSEASDRHSSGRHPSAQVADTAHLVASPSPGIFWCSPSPGAPPFAVVGQTVEASSTVGIVEIMKLMNHVKAGVDGTVLQVFAENGERVDQGQALFAIIEPLS